MAWQVGTRKLNTDREETDGKGDTHNFEGDGIGISFGPVTRIENIQATGSNYDAKSSRKKRFSDV